MSAVADAAETRPTGTREIARLGWVGLGVMGEPMAHNLLKKAGLPVTAFDLDAAVLDRFAAAGGAVADSLEDLAGAADLVFLSLPGGPQLEAVAGVLLEALPEGALIVDTTTAPVPLTRRLAERAASRAIAWADAPIARTRQAAREGTLAVMTGAEETVFARVRPFIASYASDIAHCGGIGTGQIAKLMNNMVLLQNVVALAEALTIARRNGMDGKVLFETLATGSGASFALGSHGMKAMLPGSFPKRAFSTEYMLKDLSYALELAREAGLAPAGAETAGRLLQAAIDKGYGEAYWPVLLAVIDETLEPDMPEAG